MADIRAETARARTGISGLNELIEGGFERGSVVLVAGDAGSGKSTFAIQYLYAGAAQYNEPGMLITFEEKKLDIYRHMARYGWDVQALEEQKKLVILEYPPHEIERFIAEGEIIEDTIRSLGIKRLVIDSITTFALVFETAYKRRQGILKLMESLKKWSTTSILTAEAEVDLHGDVLIKYGLPYLTDGLVYLYNLRQKDQRQRAIEILKMRGTKHSNTIFPFHFSERGIEIFSQPVFEQFAEAKRE